MYTGVENPMKIIYRIEHLMGTSQSDAFVIKPQRELCEASKKELSNVTRARIGAFASFVPAHIHFESFGYFSKIKIRKYRDSARRISNFFRSTKEINFN